MSEAILIKYCYLLSTSMIKGRNMTNSTLIIYSLKLLNQPHKKYDFPDNAKNKNVTCWNKVY